MDTPKEPPSVACIPLVRPANSRAAAPKRTHGPFTAYFSEMECETYILDSEGRKVMTMADEHCHDAWESEELAEIIARVLTAHWPNEQGDSL